MPEYSDLDSLIGKVKRAAIDVYMTDEENFYEIEGDRYRYKGSGRGMTQWVTRPGEDGSGGGDVSIDGWFDPNHLDAEFQGAFDDIRGQVDDIFDDLKDVPLGSTLHFEETRNMDAAEQLTPGGATVNLAEGGGSSLDLNNVELSGRVNAIHGYSYRLSSQTINAFRTAYADRLGAVLDGQAALAATLGMAAAGQRSVFETLRKDIARFADEARKSFEAQAAVNGGGGGGEGPVIFAVGGAIFAVASAAGGPGAIALAGLGAGGGLIETFWPEAAPKQDVEFEGDDVSSIMSSISSYKTKLLSTPIEDENTIQTALQNASAAIRDQSGSFDLSRPEYGGTRSGEDVGGPGTIKQNHDDMQALAANCQLASEDVDGARSMVESANGGATEWHRPSGIGNAPYGPFYAFDDLTADLVQLTKNTAAELSEAAQKLIKASLDFEATDSQIASTLGRETSELRKAEQDGDLLFD